MKHKNVLQVVQQFFDQKVSDLGPTPKGADYNSLEAQEVRFLQLLKLFDPTRTFSMNDYGCGYGALAHFLVKHGFYFHYSGFDISAAMVAHAEKLAPEGSGWTFCSDSSLLVPADYTIACGIFNLKFDAAIDAWETYILDTLEEIARLSKRGFAFNMLTKYSDAHRMRSDLYYGDPLFFFDYCHNNFSRNLTLLHDYGLYDFTILVRLAA